MLQQAHHQREGQTPSPPSQPSPFEGEGGCPRSLGNIRHSGAEPAPLQKEAGIQGWDKGEN